MIKTSGYRVSPTEVEEVLYASGLVAEALVYARPDDALGSAICAALWASPAGADAATRDAALLAHCRQHLPAFMLPRQLQWVDSPLPRNPNGKLDRQRWMQETQVAIPVEEETAVIPAKAGIHGSDESTAGVVLASPPRIEVRGDVLSRG